MKTKTRKNPFKIGDKVVFHSSKCETSFYDEAVHYSGGNLSDGKTYTVTNLNNNGDDTGDFYLTLEEDEGGWNHPYDIFTAYGEEEPLPKKWCIRQNASARVCKWFSKHSNTASASIDGGYRYLTWNGRSTDFSTVRVGVEITIKQFDQFLKEYEKKTTAKTKVTKSKTTKTTSKMENFTIEDFTIEGSVILREAFIKQLGYKLHSTDTISKFKYMTSDVEGVLQGSSSKYKKHFVLPTDWDEAEKYVKEYYAPKFKVGDWVVVLPEDTYYYNAKQGCAQQIKSIKEDHYTMDSGSWYTRIRKATHKEIEKEKSIIVAGYKADITKTQATFGCHVLTKAELQAMRQTMSVIGRLGYSSCEITFKGITPTHFAERALSSEVINKLLSKME